MSRRRALDQHYDRRIAIDGGLQVDDGVKASALDAFSRQGGEEGFDCVEPRSGCRRDVEPPAGMAHQPLLDLGMLVGGVVVDHSFDQFSGWHLTLDGVEEANEFGMAVALHAAADHGAVEHVEGGKQGGRAVPLVVVGHGSTATRLDRQPGLGAVASLDLAHMGNSQVKTFGSGFHGQISVGCFVSKV